ncbi:MAG: transporter [Candidatus Omnitrophica bacterium]|nr:transporter [Candidatus Omnitrophota bacterium]
MKQKLVVLIFLFAIIVSNFSLVWAVNFYDGVRAGKGLYFLTYTSYYYADKRTDANADTLYSDYDYKKIEQIFRICYYTTDAMFTIVLPITKVTCGFFDQKASAVGDIIIGAGRFLPTKKIDILPSIFVKLPTGEYESAKAINVGTNQYDIRPTIFIYKGLGRFSIDASFRYFIRLENQSTGIRPGNEWHLQGLLGFAITERLKVGPSLNWMISEPQKKESKNIANTKRESVSAGFDIYFRIPPIGITVTWLSDVYAKNLTKGDFFQIKTCYKF